MGFRLGQGEKLDELLSSTLTVAEGVLTTRSAHMLSQKLGVDSPIIENTYRVLYEQLDLREALERLMTRPLKAELRHF